MSFSTRVSVVTTKTAGDIVIETHPVPLRASRKAAFSQCAAHTFDTCWTEVSIIFRVSISGTHRFAARIIRYSLWKKFTGPGSGLA